MQLIIRSNTRKIESCADMSTLETTGTEMNTSQLVISKRKN